MAKRFYPTGLPRLEHPVLICDLDGVILRYGKGDFFSNRYREPFPGVKKALWQLIKDSWIVGVCTCRETWKASQVLDSHGIPYHVINAMWNDAWNIHQYIPREYLLEENMWPQNGAEGMKPHADFFIDDRDVHYVMQYGYGKNKIQWAKIYAFLKAWKEKEWKI